MKSEERHVGGEGSMTHPGKESLENKTFNGDRESKAQKAQYSYKLDQLQPRL